MPTAELTLSFSLQPCLRRRSSLSVNLSADSHGSSLRTLRGLLRAAISDHGGHTPRALLLSPPALLEARGSKVPVTQRSPTPIPVLAFVPPR